MWGASSSQLKGPLEPKDDPPSDQEPPCPATSGPVSASSCLCSPAELAALSEGRASSLWTGTDTTGPSGPPARGPQMWGLAGLHSHEALPITNFTFLPFTFLSCWQDPVELPAGWLASGRLRAVPLDGERPATHNQGHRLVRRPSPGHKGRRRRARGQSVPTEGSRGLRTPDRHPGSVDGEADFEVASGWRPVETICPCLPKATASGSPQLHPTHTAFKSLARRALPAGGTTPSPRALPSPRSSPASPKTHFSCNDEMLMRM